MRFLIGVAILALSIQALSAVLITCDDVKCPDGAKCLVDDGVAYCSGCDTKCAITCDGVVCPDGAECKRTGSVVHCVGCPGLPPGQCRPKSCNTTSCGGDKECKITGAVAHCKCNEVSGQRCKARCDPNKGACGTDGTCQNKQDIAFCKGDSNNASLTCDLVKCNQVGFCREVGGIATCECTPCDVECLDGPCKNGGECVALGNGAICQCPGESVDDTCKPKCLDVMCSDGCQCRITGTVIHCDCESQAGKDKFAKCANSICSNGANCRETGSVIHCRPDHCIPDAATDYGCEEPECAGPCRNGGTYTCDCICPAGYTDRFCQTPLR